MTECLKGSGSYKRPFLEAIRDTFGKRSFQYREVAGLPGFSRETFYLLVKDGWMIKVSKRSPYLYRLSTTAFCTVSADDGGRRQ